MEYDVLDYLSEEDKVEIAKQVWKEKLSAKFTKDSERIISNAAYQIVTRMCEDIVPDFHDKLVEKVKGVITQLSFRTVFDPPDVWNNDPSSSYLMLKDIVQSKKERIDNKVNKIIDDLSVNECDIDIQEEVRELLCKRLGWNYND